MSDYYRPTYSFPDGAYNATQVRLYGLPGDTTFAFETNKVKLKRGEATLSISVEKSADPQINANANEGTKILKKYRDQKLDFGETFSGIKKGSIDWPLPLPTQLVSVLPIDTKTGGYVVVSTVIGLEEVVKDRPLSSGIIFGYAYEGHTYDLPKPKIMLLPAMYETIPDDDSGYDLKKDAGYKVWIVDKLDECVEVEVNQGFIEQLVLEANLPGKRSPNMYAGKMLMAHRSGRLTE